jgi:hypothetical protein
VSFLDVRRRRDIFEELRGAGRRAVAYELPIPVRLRSALWKVKIRDRERVEPPHVTVMLKAKSWRFGLRERRFLDRKPPPSDVPEALVDHLLEHLDQLVEAWNQMYPENPVESSR